MQKQTQELIPMLLSSSSLNGLKRGVSSPRDAMYTGMLGQILTINEPSRRRLRGDVEYHFAKTTFNKSFDSDVEIIDQIKRFPPMNNKYSAKINPLTLVVYQDFETKVIDCMEITDFNSMHQKFGFKYDLTEEFENLHPRQTLPKGTVLAKSPNVTDDGDYMYGVEANVCYSSHQSGNEDAALVSESFVKRIIPTRYETRRFAIPSDRFGINLYGNTDDYRIFPEIGERVATTGLLMAFREYDVLDGVVDMTPSALMTANMHDRTIYAEPNAVVVDVKVIRNDMVLRGTETPTGMDEQLWRYYNADALFYRKILELYGRLNRQYGRQLNLGPELHRWVVEAMAICHSNPETSNHPIINTQIRAGRDSYEIEKRYRDGKLPEWTIDITFKAESIPNRGFKISGEMGDKVVICTVKPDEYLPMDDNGNRADIMINDAAVTNRIIVASHVAMYMNASARDTSKRIREMLNYTLDTKREWFYDPVNLPLIQKAFDYALGWYKIASPFVYEALMEDIQDPTLNAMITHVEAICLDGIYPHFPTDNPVFVPDMISELRTKYRPDITPVTFKGLNGRQVRTKKPLLIASKYMLILEKTGEDWSAVADPKRGCFGTVASITNSDRYTSAVRKQSVKAIGETETALLAATIGGDVLADYMDAVNSPSISKDIFYKILTAPDVTDIDEVVDRKRHPIGDNRPLQLTRHIFEMSGKRVTNK